MEVKFEVLLSSSIKRREPWPRFCWLGKVRLTASPSVPACVLFLSFLTHLDCLGFFPPGEGRCLSFGWQSDQWNQFTFRTDQEEDPKTAPVASKSVENVQFSKRLVLSTAFCNSQVPNIASKRLLVPAHMSVFPALANSEQEKKKAKCPGQGDIQGQDWEPAVWHIHISDASVCAVCSYVAGWYISFWRVVSMGQRQRFLKDGHIGACSIWAGLC